MRGLRLLQKDVDIKISKRCIESDYILVKPFIYVNNKSKIILKCIKDNYIWEISYNNFINKKTGCPKCSGTLKYTHDEVLEKIKIKCNQLNYIIIEPFVYKNNHSNNLKLKCLKDNYQWNTSYKKFINLECGCPKCSGLLKLTQQESENKVNQRCEEENYELLYPFIYKNGTKTHLTLKCKKDGYIWESIFSNFVYLKYGCSRCGNNLLTTQQEAENKVKLKCEEKNYTLLNEFIYNSSLTTKISLSCNLGHKWFPNYNDFVNLDSGCPHCKESKGEKIIDLYLKEKNIKYKREFKFDDCKNKLKLPFDFYLPEENICVEYDGEQHYKSINNFGGEMGLKSMQIRDQIKTDYCKNNNIKLIRIPYFEIKNIEKILDENIK
jgi:very-short-patch-repair endonuclease/ribosomal protein S27AE